eukprot:scaffold75780_cov18-Tisochrysis_lutea.AAC.1
MPLAPYQSRCMYTLRKRSSAVLLYRQGSAPQASSSKGYSIINKKGRESKQPSVMLKSTHPACCNLRVAINTLLLAVMLKNTHPGCGIHAKVCAAESSVIRHC